MGQLKNHFSLREYFRRILVFPGASLSPSGKKLAYISSLKGSSPIWIAETGQEVRLIHSKPVTEGTETAPLKLDRLVNLSLIRQKVVKISF